MTDSAVAYCLRRSERAKHTRIVVKADGRVEVVAPMKVAETRIRRFVTQQQDWIQRAQQRLLARQASVPAIAPPEYADGGWVPYLGQQVPLQVQAGLAKTVRVLHRQDGFVVQVPESVLNQGDVSEYIRQALIKWMKQQTRRQALELLAHYAAVTGLQARSLTLKTLKSRWGSCGPRNDINLNWLLVLGPPVVLEYVVVHELCHIRHKNHSADFWQLVAQIMPDYQQHRRWLKQQGAQLMRGL